MFHHLKIKEAEVLKQSKLLNLGKVNVICGKNNSGKTTLLEAINKKENVLVGKKLDKDTIDFLGTTLNEKASEWKFGTGYRTYGNVPVEINFGVILTKVSTRKVFEELASFKRVWFADEVPLFLEKLWSFLYQEIYTKQASKEPLYIASTGSYIDLQQYSKNENIQKQWKDIISKIFDAAFFKKFFKAEIDNVILISPKRIVTSEINFSRVTEVETDGRNIISKLFDLKNKLSGSSYQSFYKKLYDSFIKVSGSYKFDIEVGENEVNRLNLFFSFVDKENWIKAKSCGLGLQDLLVILYFALEPRNSLILIEEPENHIHPEMQRKLLRFLAEETDKQFFITTHSNVFVNSTYVDRVFFTKFEENTITVDDETKQAEMLHDLGYSVTDNLVSDLIILVEGPSDTPFIEEFLNKLGVDAKYNIKTWALGGDIMDKHNLSVFAERYKVMALIDNDPKSQKSRKRFVDNCKDLDIPVTRLKRYAIENYFSVRALKEVFKSQIPKSFEEVEPSKTLFDQIGLNVKNNNRKLAKEMTLEEIEGTDLKVFFDKVQTTLQNL